MTYRPEHDGDGMTGSEMTRAIDEMRRKQSGTKAWAGTVGDSRGLIEEICDKPVQSVTRIFSRAGSIRSNHYHKTDWHVLYVVSGCMDYFEFDRNKSGPPTIRSVLDGEHIYTGPNVEHTTIFPEDTVLLCFAGNKRDRAGYEDDLVRVGNLEQRIREGEFHRV